MNIIVVRTHHVTFEGTFSKRTPTAGFRCTGALRTAPHHGSTHNTGLSHQATSVEPPANLQVSQAIFLDTIPDNTYHHIHTPSPSTASPQVPPASHHLSHPLQHPKHLNPTLTRHNRIHAPHWRTSWPCATNRTVSHAYYATFACLCTAPPPLPTLHGVVGSAFRMLHTKHPQPYPHQAQSHSRPSLANFLALRDKSNGFTRLICDLCVPLHRITPPADAPRVGWPSQSCLRPATDPPRKSTFRQCIDSV